MAVSNNNIDIERRKGMKSLKELRDHNNLSRKEVAQHIGVSDRVYAYYEQGRTLPAKYVKPLANLFGISCDELLENNTESLDWEKEFGCIERTIKLDLPKWEDIEKDKFFHYIRHFVITKNFSFFIEIYKFTNTISISWSGGCKKTDPQFDRTWELTKENYTLACRKAKELFLKGNVND